jgi:16S rRNA processing protein RimM
MKVQIVDAELPDRDRATPDRHQQSPDAMDWNEMALVGRIARPHGIRGQVIVNLDTDFPETRFQSGAELFIERAGRIEKLRLTTVRFQHERPVVGIDGVATMTDAQALAGAELRVPVDWLAPLPPDTFYRHELIGCRVETAAGENVGLVGEIEGTFEGSRLVIAGQHAEIQVPLTKAICTTIDVTAKRIVIEPPQGLLDLNG